MFHFQFRFKQDLHKWGRFRFYYASTATSVLSAVVKKETQLQHKTVAPVVVNPRKVTQHMSRLPKLLRNNLIERQQMFTHSALSPGTRILSMFRFDVRVCPMSSNFTNICTRSIIVHRLGSPGCFKVSSWAENPADRPNFDHIGDVLISFVVHS